MDEEGTTATDQLDLFPSGAAEGGSSSIGELSQQGGPEPEMGGAPVHSLGRSTAASRPQLKRLQGEHLQFLEMHVAGWTNKEIAEYFECTPQTVSNVLTSDLGKAWLEERRAGMDEEFYGLYNKVIHAVDDGLSEARPIEVRLVAADKWLKAHGRYAPKQGKTEAITAEDIAQRLLERGAIAIKDSQVVINTGGPHEAVATGTAIADPGGGAGTEHAAADLLQGRSDPPSDQ